MIRTAIFYDIDGDGFSNVYEYMMHTDMGNVRNHPPLWHRLRVIEVGRIALPIKLVSVNTMDSDDPKQWELRIDANGMSSFYMIGTELEVDGRFFMIESVDRQAGAGPDKKDLFCHQSQGDERRPEAETRNGRSAPVVFRQGRSAGYLEQAAVYGYGRGLRSASETVGPGARATGSRSSMRKRVRCFLRFRRNRRIRRRMKMVQRCLLPVPVAFRRP